VLKGLAEATEQYHQQLLSPEGERHYEYLNVERGLDHQTIVHFKLGAVLDANASHEQAAGMLAIPYMTPAGVVQMRFRKAPWRSGAKYWQTSGSLVRMYNTNLLLNPDRDVFVCEGEFDTMAATQAGLPAVGIAGVNGWRSHFYLMLAGFDRVTFLADRDSDSDSDEGKAKPDDWPEDKEWKPITQAGLKFANKHADNLDGGQVIQMPDGHDVNTFLIERGAEELRAYVGFRSHA
jgi:DNA primase